MFFRFCGQRRPAADAAVGRRRPPAASIGGIAAHCCGIFSCTNPPVWPVGVVVVVAGTVFLAILHHIIVFQCFLLFFYDFCCFLLLWIGWDGLGMVRMWLGMHGM